MKKVLFLAALFVSCQTIWAQTSLSTPMVRDDLEVLVKHGNYVYMAGVYTIGNDTVGGLVRVDAQTGALDINWDPQPNDDINELIVQNGQLIVGGRFTQIAGQPRKHIAVFDAATGALQPIAPQVSSRLTGRGVQALYSSGNTIYCGFDRRIKRFDLTTGVVDNWAADTLYTSDIIRTMTIMGNHLYVGGEFYILQSPPPSTATHDLIRYDVATGAFDASWAPVVQNINGYYNIAQVLTHNNMLYVCGSFNNLAGQTREGGVAAFDAGGNLTSLDPNILGGQNFSINAQGDRLWVGGNFYWFGGDHRWRGAVMDINTGMAIPCWDAHVATSAVWDIEVSGDTVYMGCVGPSVGTSAYKVYVGETELPTPLYITGPDTVFAGEPATFVTSPLSFDADQAEWMRESDYGSIQTSWGDTLTYTWNQLGTRTVSLYHSMNYGCYSDTISKQVVVVASPGSGVISSQVDVNWYYYQQGAPISMYYRFDAPRPSPTDLLIELSDANGDFTNSTIVGSKTAPAFSTTGFIDGVICGIPEGRDYRARVIAAIGSYVYQTIYYPSDWDVGRIDSTPHPLTVLPDVGHSSNAYCSPPSITYRPTFDIFILDSSYTTYEWYKNGQYVDDSITYIDNNPQDLDSVYLIATTYWGCAVQSIPHVLAVTDTTVPTLVQLSSNLVGTGPICPGSRDTVRVTSFSSGHTQNPDAISNFSYYWIERNNRGGTIRSWGSMPALPQQRIDWERGDSLFIQFYSYNSCQPYNLLGSSDTLIPTFYAPPEVTMHTTASDTICSGQIVNFTTSLVNGASQPIYWWRVNGSTVLYGSDSTYSTTSLQDGDEVYVEVIGSAICSGDRDTSNHITFTIDSAGATFNNVVYTTDTIYPSECETYTSPSGNHTWTSSGTYLDTVTNIITCDSAVVIEYTIDLTILSPSAATIDTTLCLGGSFLGFNGTGTYTTTLVASNGCDSVVTVNLIVEDYVSQSRPALEWENTFGGSLRDNSEALDQTTDGGYIMAGYSYSNDGDVTGNNGGDDYWVVKVNSLGNLEWQKTLGGTDSERASAVKQAPDGNYLVLGYSRSTDGDVSANNGSRDYWLVKLDQLGNIIWEKSYGGSLDDYGTALEITNDGGIMIGGYARSSNGDVSAHKGGNDYWLVKLDPSGNIIWDKSYGGTGWDYLEDIEKTDDGGYVLAGYAGSNDGDVTGYNGSLDYWIVKIDSIGNLEWQNSLGGSSSDYAYSVTQTRDGDFVATGRSYSTDGDISDSRGDMDCWVVKLDANGTLLWEKSLGGSSSDEGHAIEHTDNNTYVIAGYSYSNDGDVTGNRGSSDIWIVELDSAGNLLGQRSIGGSRSDLAYEILQTPDGGLVVSGTTFSIDGDVTSRYNSSNDISGKFWIVKLRLDSIQTTNVSSCGAYTSPSGNYVWTTNGFYQDTITTANGCDSIVKINLTISQQTVTQTLNPVSCGSYTSPSGNYVWTVSGNYMDTIPNPGGCDSILTINLTVTPLSTIIDSTVCVGDSVFGYITTGQYIDTLTSSGCQSIRTLNLTVTSYLSSTITTTICSGSSVSGYSTTGQYIDTFSIAGCDSIRTLNLTVIPWATASINQTICFGNSFAGYSSSGIYIDTFSTAGCDSIRTLNLTVTPWATASINQTVCFGNSFAGYSSSGIYIDTFSTAGCDSIRTLNLTVTPWATASINQTICFGNSFAGYSNSGIYTDTFSTAGCDSIRTLNLTVLPTSNSSMVQTICQGDSLYGYTQAGIYTDTFTAANTCDSVRTIDLTVLPTSMSTITTTICTGSSVYGYSATGQYIDTFNISGCDSIRTLNLTVTPLLTSIVNATVCQGSTVSGYGATGQYIDTFSTASCDSIRTLNLTVLSNSSSSLTMTICDGESYQGYGQTGIYIDTLTAANSCDSIRTINLTVVPNSMSTITTTICDGDAYMGHTQTGVYLDTFVAANGCDSLQTINLTVLPNSTDTISIDIYDGQSYAGYNNAGIYWDTFSAANGCDSIRLLDLTVIPLDTVWPGDANSDGVVDNTDFLNIGIAYGSTGALRPGASTAWVGQACQPWSSNFVSGVNYNHADCNGDGLVDADDSTAVLLNYGQVHAKTTPKVNKTDPILYLEPENTVLESGDPSQLFIRLGNQSLPVNDLYGLAFTINYESNYIDSASIAADFSICWVGSEGFDLITLQKPISAGQIDLAMVRNNQQNVNGFGDIGVLQFTTEQLFGSTQDTIIADFQITGVLAVDSLGNTIPLNIGNTTVAIRSMPLGVANPSLGNIQIHPNPTSGAIQIISERPIEQIKIFNMVGQSVVSMEVDKLNSINVDLDMLENGLYMVNLFDGTQWHLIKVVLTK